ncbi:hypothetical protein SS50377_25186 [Spironucleus salmonicida]|uniref:Uncharacterized protein n=1 Tax=Spironucleus salmonicida TaxID=348837 RepID=V6LQI6_9EUKA|nr:hypothetical protein SS50377_25186 [Spironucleus salmonicida]|eukprot:EST46845.1 Hypothetical protein SS50377_13109 [Spironucleus salmonicida]
MIFLITVQQRNIPIPATPGNINNLTFAELKAKLPSASPFNPKILSPEIRQKIPKKYLDDPIKYRNELNNIRIDQLGETVGQSQDQLRFSNSSDPMVRLNPQIRSLCKFSEIEGVCEVKEIIEDPEHASLCILTFQFGGEQYFLKHRYRNPFLAWVQQEKIKIGSSVNCIKLTKIEGSDSCLDTEWEFTEVIHAEK